MLIAFRWTLRLFTGLVLLILLAGWLAYYVLSRSLPDYSESFTLEGISAPVEIVRNNANVPHIFGGNEADVFYALGFVHAQDRLWQMTMLRRTAQGKLSEIFGARTVKIDELLRRLDLYELSLQSVAAQDARTTTALEAYSAGVNAWINEVNAGARGRGAPEFFLFSNEISAWAPADSIAIVKLMALQMSSHLQSEVQRAQLSQILTPPRLADILPEDPTQGIAALPPYASLMPGPYAAPNPSAMAYLDEPLSPFVSRAFAGASNAFAALPSRSAAGGSLLANDPHLGLTAPSIWYLARLDLPTGGVIGGTIPGMPLMLVGRSDKLGWGLTSAYVDDQDVVMEKVNPDNTEEYLTPEGPKPFRTAQTIITVKDEAPITITQRWSESGPILPGTHYDLASVTPPGTVAALQWTALSGADTSMMAGLRLMTAQSVAEAMAAGRLFVAPSQNLTLADQSSIALQTIGAVPQRDASHVTRGRMPAPGWEGSNRWTGVQPYATNPSVMNPTSGIVGNTNNKTVDRPFPDHVSFDWGDTQRVQRWLALMTAREVHTRDSFIEAQLDTVSPTARNILPLIGADLWFTGEPAPEGTPERLRQRALTLLAEWNGEMNEHMPEPLIAEAWLRALQDRLARDEIGPLADGFTHPEPLFLERVYKNIDGASVWCDVLQSAAVETCTDIARIALDEALLGLVERWGPNLESWRWGDAHQATHDHPVLGDVPGLRFFVNIRQSSSGGDTTLMRGRTKGTGPEPYWNVHAGAYRGVYDFADPDSSVFIVSTGQSGHPLSRFYDDLSELWRRGEYIPMSLDPALARAAAVGATVLTPQVGGMTPALILRPHGRLGNHILQWITGMTLARQVPGLTLHNFDLPPWGLAAGGFRPRQPFVPALVEQDSDLALAAGMMRSGQMPLARLRCMVLQAEAWGEPERFRRLLPLGECAVETSGPDEILLNVRAEEILKARRPDYGPIPLGFYHAVSRETGLKPVFVGQLGEDSYSRLLRDTFPTARFLPSQGVRGDFDAMRRAHHLALSVSTFSWVAGWLSDAQSLHVPVLGFLNPAQRPDIALLPLGDARFHCYGFAPRTWEATAAQIDDLQQMPPPPLLSAPEVEALRATAEQARAKDRLRNSARLRAAARRVRALVPLLRRIYATA